MNTSHPPSDIPSFLAGNPAAYAADPRQAALEWFRQARFGLFMHYGLYSILAGEWPGAAPTNKGSEWIQWTAGIPVKTYGKLQQQFTAEGFDADVICQLAKDAGMRYVNLTTQHHDGFCLWDSQTTEFTSMHAPAGRDLVAELTEACDRHGLACFLYYSHGREWLHPDGPDTGIDVHGFNSSKPWVADDKEYFHFGADVQLDRYLDLVSQQVAELCQYKHVAGIWLDGIGSFKKIDNGVALSRCQELYDQIHASSPHILVAYKQGLTYTEDFYAPERHITDGTVPSDGRPYEICTTLQPKSWGYKKADDGQHQSADWVLEQLAAAAKIPANLLLNTGPLADGSIPQEDQDILREVGRRLQAELAV